MVRAFLAASIAALLIASPAHVAAAAEKDAVRLSFASTFPGNMALIGEGAMGLADKIARASGGAIKLQFQEPGTTVPAKETLHAVADGRVDAGWGGAGWFAEFDSTFNMFSAVPFGPDTGEYLAWMYHGGGLEAARAMFAARNLYNIPCALIPPEASGWFRKEIRTVADFRGLRMRFFGLGAKVMQKLGAKTEQLPPGEIYQALESGTIDAAEFSLPVMDQRLGLNKVARYYYFPAWHQQATFFDLYINLKRWHALHERHKAVIELACGDMIRATIAEGEAVQWKAMRQMQAEGVQIRNWAPEIIAAMESAWNEVAAEETSRNPNFKRVYESYLAFRRDYTIWRERAYLR
ncbi:MAG TPA: TRAP transporter substrate-binding protein [Alphaproteobacteria bacterium]|nr:TRAP transporter substrate-binding protein [Alphaproteobacteria bacterium]